MKVYGHAALADGSEAASDKSVTLTVFCLTALKHLDLSYATKVKCNLSGIIPLSWLCFMKGEFTLIRIERLLKLNVLLNFAHVQKKTYFHLTM